MPSTIFFSKNHLNLQNIIILGQKRESNFKILVKTDNTKLFFRNILTPSEWSKCAGFDLIGMAKILSAEVYIYLFIHFNLVP
jgi:hypothetical protein